MNIFAENITFKWIKENLALIVLAPTILGGIWQLLELSCIGTPYIRFFSVSQLIPDGLLILFVTAILLLASKLIDYRDANIVSQNIETEKATGPTSIKRHKSWYQYVVVSLLLALMIIIVFLLPLLKDINATDKVSVFNLAVIVALTFAAYKLIKNGLIVFFQITGWGINVKSKWVESLLYLIFGILFLLSFFVVVPCIRIFHNSFLLPGDFKNMERIRSIVKAKNEHHVSFRLMYFNDKYIFVNVQDNKKSSYIQVLKFDEFLSSPSNN